MVDVSDSILVQEYPLTKPCPAMAAKYVESRRCMDALIGDCVSKCIVSLYFNR